MNTPVRFRTLEIEHFDFRTPYLNTWNTIFVKKISVLNRTLIKLIRTHRTYFSNTWKCPKVVAMRYIKREKAFKLEQFEHPFEHIF